MGNYIPRRPLSVFAVLFGKIAFRIKQPFAVLAFKRRERKAFNRTVPRLWLSQGELLARDLENYEPKDNFTLDLKFIEDFAKARDELLGQIKKQLIFSVVVFVFAFSKYLGLKLPVSVAGFSLTDAPGIIEGLLLASNLLSCYTLMLQANVFLIESAIKHAINRTVPEELRALYIARYFPHENFGVYRPFNLPHIIPNAPSRAISRWTSLVFLLLLFLVLTAYIVSNTSLLVYFLLLHPQLGVASYVLLGFILSCGACSFLYVILTRFRMPYLDWTVNHELELLQQINRPRWRERLNEIYGEMIEDRKRMEDRGFLKRRPPPEIVKKPPWD